MSDLISRQDAIKAMCGDCDGGQVYPKCDQVEWCSEVNVLLALPSAEAVSREEYEEVKAHMDTLVDAFIEDGEELAEAESAEAEWIPCSKGLPSEDGRYLVTYPLLRWQNNWINLMYYGKPSMPNCEVKGKCFYVSDDEWGDVVYDNILAWMPLPDPYREDGEA